MSTYDKIALSNRPTLYLSAPEITDKSGGNFSLTANNLSPTGQPIIFGSESSFLMSSTSTVGVVGNPLFFNDTATFECVIYASRPTQAVPIIIDNALLNSLLITPDGVVLQLFLESQSSTYSKTASIGIKNWSQKFYITVAITATQATLTVNGESDIIVYNDNVTSSIDVTIGGGYTDYQYLIDGVGFYNKTISNKESLINDPLSGYSAYAAAKYGGTTTKFEGYTTGYRHVFKPADFLYSDGQFTLIYYVTAIQAELDYIIVRSNDERITVSYDVDLDDAGEFVGYLLINAVVDKTLRFVINADEVESDFELSIEGVSNGDVLYETPADLELSGLALFGKPTESIVNYADGTKLEDAAFAGTWMTDPPLSIEIVFRPEDDTQTIVYQDASGSVSYGASGSITGFTAYLNGALVTDLTTVRHDQWNHLTLTRSVMGPTEFSLNSADGLPASTTISYMLLTGYPVELDAAQILSLYEVLSGIDKLNVSESITIAEGTFASGQSFNAYSYAWAILGAGGS